MPSHLDDVRVSPTARTCAVIPHAAFQLRRHCGRTVSTGPQGHNADNLNELLSCKRSPEPALPAVGSGGAADEEDKRGAGGQEAQPVRGGVLGKEQPRTPQSRRARFRFVKRATRRRPQMAADHHRGEVGRRFTRSRRSTSRSASSVSTSMMTHLPSWYVVAPR